MGSSRRTGVKVAGQMVSYQEIRDGAVALGKYFAKGRWGCGKPFSAGWITAPSLKGGVTHIGDVRGWGYLTGGGHGALGLSEKEAVEAHDAIGGHMARMDPTLTIALIDRVEQLERENEELRSGRKQDKNSQPRLAAALLVFNDKGELLMIQRQSGADTGARQWTVPGGKLEHGERLLSCAVRETEEETGISAVEAVHVDFTENVFAENGKHYVCHYFVATEWEGSPTIREPSKHMGLAWRRPEDLPDEALYLPHRDLKARGTYEAARQVLAQHKSRRQAA